MDSLVSAQLQQVVQPQTFAAKQAVVAFARLDCTVSAEELQAEIGHLLQQSWVDHVNKRDYQGGWDVLPLRCLSQHVDAHPVLQGFAIGEGDKWQDLPVLAACPIISRALAGLKCPLKAVRLMRLKAGAEIKPHRDHELGIEHGEARLHIPIHTSDKVLFTVNEQRVPMGAGELWYINTDMIHAVINAGDEDRINLVIDCVANDWLREKIQQASAV